MPLMPNQRLLETVPIPYPAQRCLRPRDNADSKQEFLKLILLLKGHIMNIQTPALLEGKNFLSRCLRHRCFVLFFEYLRNLKPNLNKSRS